jgi:SAM-dependent methyltransferase
VDHDDHVRLIREGVRGAGTTWADLGSGRGAFTLALAELLVPDGTVFSVDRDAAALQDQARAMAGRFPTVVLHQLVADFTGALALPKLDGVIMANSLHFVEDKLPVVRRIGERLGPGGRFILVEYDADHGNRWVPYPVSQRSWELLAAAAGLAETRVVGRVPSRFLGSIYAAASRRQASEAAEESSLQARPAPS